MRGKKLMKGTKVILIFLFAIIALTGCGSGGISESSFQNAELSENLSGENSWVSWVKNEDGTFTFTNKIDEGNSRYAWYILDNKGNTLYKTKYSDSPQFCYDLQNDTSLIIKGFVRNGTEKDFEQNSYKISSRDVLEEKQIFVIDSTELPEDGYLLFKNEILTSGQATFPVEEILVRNGKRWDIDLEIPMNWSCPNISNRSYGYRTNGLLFLDDTYQEYCETKDKKYAEIILSYMIDWCTQNKKYNENDIWQWHDDATALRVQRMSLYYFEFSDLCSKDERILIKDSLSYQAKLLASNEFYTEKHNHGMHQDMALIFYSLLIEESEQIKKEYLSTALSRTRDYIGYVYQSDGVHKEHSPFYANDVLNDMIFYRNITRNTSEDFVLYIEKYINGCKEYLIQILKPDGNWPSLGDSSEENGVEALRQNILLDEKYQYILTGGKDGCKPASNVVFKEGGSAVFRSSWDATAKDATWMYFNAATFSSTHKHGDDLEVLLYHRGDLFVEAGKRNYNYLDEMTAWAYSGYAHNVLLVDGEAFPVKTGENGFQSIYPDALDTGIVDYNLDDNNPSVTGYQHRFDGVEQTRTLSYNRNENVVEIVDVMDGTTSYKGTLLWHVAQNVEVRELKNGWNFYRDGELVASMEISSDSNISFRTITGEGEYPYMTWIFNGKEEPQNGTLLCIDYEGEEGENSITAKINLY